MAAGRRLTQEPSSLEIATAGKAPASHQEERLVSSTMTSGVYDNQIVNR
jgi:hypothetical protein